MLPRVPLNLLKIQAIRKTLEQLVMVKEEILTITRSVMTKFGKQLDTNKQDRITVMDFEKAWRIQRIEMGLPIEIDKSEIDVKDSYKGVSDEELVEELELLTKRYKDRLDEKKQRMNEVLHKEIDALSPRVYA